MLLALISILDLLIRLFTIVVVVRMILGLLLSFNVINLSNQFVDALWRALNAILDPILRPIQKFMPDTGAIDFSPMVLIVLLMLVQRVLVGMYTSVTYGTL